MVWISSNSDLCIEPRHNYASLFLYISVTLLLAPVPDVGDGCKYRSRAHGKDDVGRGKVVEQSLSVWKLMMKQCQPVRYANEMRKRLS